NLGVHVIKVSLNDGDLFVEPRNVSFGGLANHDAHDIRLPCKVGGSRPITNGRHTHRRLRPKAVAKRGDNGRARWRYKLLFYAIRIGRLALKQIRRSRRRYWQNSM